MLYKGPVSLYATDPAVEWLLQAAEWLCRYCWPVLSFTDAHIHAQYYW